MKNHLQCSNGFRKLFLAIAIGLFYGPLFAQQTVTGTVTDENGEALPGVSVILLNEGSTGTVTDLSGRYTINNVPQNATLVFTFIGYEKQTVKISGRQKIDVAMKQTVTELGEVVVIGYGTQQKGSLTGSVSQVDDEALQMQPVANVSQALQGSVPGINVTTSNRPGSNAQIRIHGLGTINNNNPLWVVDGVPSSGGLEALNPNEIESITVLKDAASTAIYGARGANGVILVTSIQGRREQPTQVNFNVRTGVISNNKKHDMLSVEEFGEMLWLQAKNSGVTPTHPQYGSGAEPRIPKYIIPAGADQADLSQYDQVTFPITEANAQGTDWYNEIYNPGMTQDYNLSVTGGSENTNYGISAGYLNEEGMVKLTGFKRYKLRTNLSTDLTNWLEIGQNLGLSHTNDWGYQAEGGSNSPFGQLLELTAIMPVRDVMGNWAPTSRIVGLQAQNNPVARLHRRQDVTGKDLGVRGNAYADFSILENLSLRSLIGLNIGDFRSKTPLEKNPESYIARPSAELTEYQSRSRQWNWTNTLNYSTTFADIHDVEVLLGTEAIENNFENFSATRTDFFLTNEDYWVLSGGEGEMRNGGSASDWSTFSYFGRVHYEFAGKYLLDATFRRDGSSRFGRKNRYGNFPAFSVGWRLSEEAFMQPAGNWLDFLKIRASWGESGNDQIGNYNGFTTFRTNPTFSYYPITGSNSDLTSGFESAAFGNPDAKWETTITKNIGVDATLFDLIDLTVDVWQRDTEDMLYPRSIPFVAGVANVPSVNIGNMRNTGFDASLNFYGSGLNQELKFNITANVSHYKNEIVKLSDVEQEAIIGSSIREQVYTRAENGTSFPQFYGYEVLGIFQSEDEANSHPPAFGEDGAYNKPGRFKYKDVNVDNVINDEDRTYIGNPHPDFTAGLNINLEYKGFDLNTFFYSSVGNDLLNLSRRTLDFNLFQRNRAERRLYESWGSPHLEDNKDAKMPIAELNDIGSQVPSSYYIEDGSFLRLQNVQLGYSLPEDLINPVGLKKLRIYVMGTNLFTITDYTGLDPQIQTSDSRYGIDLGEWPTPQRFLVGLNIGL